MNIEQAKSITLAQILDILGRQPTQEKNNEAWYLSPFRNERTPSFKVNIPLNVWYDHGIGKGGDGISLVCHHLETTGESFTVSDALRWLSNMTGQAPKIMPVAKQEVKRESSKYFIDGIESIKHALLIEYLETRGIPLTVAERYMKQVKVVNRETKKYFLALGMSNESNGWDIRNKFFKGCIGRKNITFIRGSDPDSKGFHLFEGGFDFMSALIQQENGQPFKEDAIITHSVAILTKATPYIKNYGYKIGYTWMDNDEAGKKATISLDNFFKTEDQLFHKPMNNLYTPYKDVNAWHMKKLGLCDD